MKKGLVSICAVVIACGSSYFQAQAAGEEEGVRIVTFEHTVPHVSTMPANDGDSVELFVQERYADKRKFGKAVVMVHGRSVPALAGFALNHEPYDWALQLAKAGFDVFIVDLQGSGKSPRPRMDNACNASNFAPDFQQRRLLVPNPLKDGECAAAFPFRLVSSKSEWDELDTVVDYIRNHRGVEKVSIVSWSRGSLVAGPYTVQHPEKVESLFLLAPIYNPNAIPGLGPDGFAPPVKVVLKSPLGTCTRAEMIEGKCKVAACSGAEVIGGKCTPALPPEIAPLVPATAMNPTMSLIPRNDFVDGSLVIPGFKAPWDVEIRNAETQCGALAEDGIQDIAWNAIMDNDVLGQAWGPEGVMRVRSFVPWGWVPAIAARITVPVLIIFGEFDNEARAERFPVADNSPLLYETIPHEHKILFKVACAGHRMVWERQAKVLHHISKQWLKHGAVEDFTNGRFYVDTEGNLFQM